MQSQQLNQLLRATTLFVTKAASRSEAALERKLASLFGEAEQKLKARLREKASAFSEQDARIVLEATRKKADALILSATVEETARPGRVIDELKQHAFEASRNTMQRLQGDVMKTLREGYREGLGTGEMAELIGKNFKGMSEGELKRIARTEINSAQNASAFQQMKDAGIAYHQWITAEDERVRSTHEELHDEITRVGEPFSNGLKFPGDRSGPIEEWINCRCVTTPFILPPGTRAPEGPFFESDLEEMETTEEVEVEVEEKSMVSVDEWLRSMNPGDREWYRDGIEDWTSGSQDIRNLQLSGKGSKTTKESLDALDEMFRVVQPQKATVYRGLELEEDAFNRLAREMQPGKAVRWDAHTSTSLSERIAGQFASGSDYECLITVEGKSGVDIAKFYNLGPNQKELIFPRGTKLKVVSSEIKKKPYGIMRLNIRMVEL